MLKWFVAFGVLLVVLAGRVSAETALNAGTDQVAEQANRYLSAELTKQIKGMGDDLDKSLKAYQDENFMALDQRMSEEMDRMQKKLMFGGLGVLLVGNAVVALFLIRQFRQYSYEKYLQDIIKLQGKEQEKARVDMPSPYMGGTSFAQMQQAVWNPQVPNTTIGMKFGQAQASDMTQMNAWQTTPAYAGSWGSPVEVKKEEYVPLGSQKPVWGQTPYDSTPSWRN